MAQSSTVRTIRKYPNRRLYDTEESRYITLADVRELVLNRVRFAVIDKPTGDDITRCILLQVICEQEQNGDAILSEAFLSRVIRAYGMAAPELLADHLEGSLDLLLGRQQGVPHENGEFSYEHVTPKIP